MLLIDHVVTWVEGSITCAASIGKDHPFLDDGKVDMMVCVELVAQSVAAYAGYADHVRGRPTKVGFLVSCREASFDADGLVAGDELEVTAKHLWGETSLGSFGGHVTRRGVRIATVEIGVFGGSLGSAGESL
jgi:predicted hotdog family 3-hydroxylacyl-ACP dehydratase